uniref:Calcium channel, voltage dependent, alpha2/delta subunit 3 n=1 Tax=Dicentrarchus labrax TaxID=13489 RepID=A0A8P4GI48_DICLA
NELINVRLNRFAVHVFQCYKIYSCSFCQCHTFVSGYFQKYKEFEKSVRVEEIDGLKLVKNLAVKMEEVFRKKAEATRRLVEAAEEAHHQHEENPDLQYEYFNAVLINEVDEMGNNVELGGEFLLEPNDHFNNLSVNLSLSVVQVPTNMYNKDPDIVNGVYWSEALNKVFVDNFERDPTLIWQYFGSAKGFFRQYPGVKWHPDEHGVIGFDCRNRKWYIQAATSPKDVVILVDVSGSMKGLRLTIARQTVSSILDTLGDDDFFNVIAYNQEIHYVEPCLNGTLVRADRTNKDHFREHLDKLFAKGIGLLGEALAEAFTILNDFNQTGRGSVCSQAIMLVTDGATEMYDDVFEKYNWPERKVRIFPYLIGRESAFADNLKWMACANKGYFSQISTLADVQENVMRYLHVMSRPKVIDHEHDTVWTEAYVDSLNEKAGPSLMTTVAMPVFITSNFDVLVLYFFLLYQDGQKRRKPNYSSVDLSEVEWEDKDDILRNAMVNRRTGTFSMEVKKTVDRGRRVLKMHNDYYYTDIKGTPFSVGVALSRGHGKYFFRGNVSVEAGMSLTLYVTLTCLFGRVYCISLPRLALSLNCAGDRELIQEVLFDAVVTAPLEAYWTGLALNKSENSDKGVEITFLGTRTGLSRTNLFVPGDQDFLTAEDKEGVFNADHFPLWYKRAAEQVPGTFVYSIPFSTALDGKCSISCDNGDINCYLIDNNGFILVTEEQSQVLSGGMSIFQLKVTIAAICMFVVCEKRGESVRELDTFSAYLWFSQLLWFLISFHTHSAQRSRGKTMMVPCDTEYPAFVSERTIKETTGNIECEGCVRSFVIQQIPSSNLFMVVVDNKCDCSSAPPVTMDPIEIMYILSRRNTDSLKCDRLKFQKDRKKPESCHPFHPEV